MSKPKTPLENYVTLPSTGDTMTPAVWHAMIDGLEMEDFGASDFRNGDARVITRTSEPPTDDPAFALGAVWSHQSEASFVWGSSNYSEPFLVAGERLEMYVICATNVSVGSPLYVEGMTSGSGWSGAMLPVATLRTTKRGVAWSPNVLFSVDNAGPGEVARATFLGFGWCISGEAEATIGDVMYFDSYGGVEIRASKYAYPSYSALARGSYMGAWMENWSGSSGDAPRRVWKMPPINEDRDG